MKAINRFRWLLGLSLLAAVELAGGSSWAQDGVQAPPDGQLTDENRAEALYRIRVEGGSNLDRSSVVTLATDGGLGASLGTVDPVLREHLNLPKDLGFVVMEVTPDSPAAKGGLKANDILVKVLDQPLNRVDDVEKAFRDAGNKAVKIEVIRAGRPTTVEVTPQQRFSFLAAQKGPGALWIGVAVGEVDDSVRAHLNLPKGQGLVASQVVPDSPAAQAGVKVNDILLKLGDKPLTSTEDLLAQIQAMGTKTGALEIIHAGQKKTVQITPAKQEATNRGWKYLNPEGAAQRDAYLKLVRPGVAFWDFNHPAGSANPNSKAFDSWLKDFGRGDQHQGGEPGSRESQLLNQIKPGFNWSYQTPNARDPRLDEVLKELKALHNSVEELKKAIKKD